MDNIDDQDHVSPYEEEEYYDDSNNFINEQDQQNGIYRRSGGFSTISEENTVHENDMSQLTSPDAVIHMPSPPQNWRQQMQNKIPVKYPTMKNSIESNKQGFDDKTSSFLIREFNNEMNIYENDQNVGSKGAGSALSSQNRMQQINLMDINANICDQNTDSSSNQRNILAQAYRDQVLAMQQNQLNKLIEQMDEKQNLQHSISSLDQHIFNQDHQINALRQLIDQMNQEWGMHCGNLQNQLQERDEAYQQIKQIMDQSLDQSFGSSEYEQHVSVLSPELTYSQSLNPSHNYSGASADIPNLEKKIQEQNDEISKLKITTSTDSNKVKAMQFETKLLQTTYCILVLLYFFWKDLFQSKISLF